MGAGGRGLLAGSLLAGLGLGLFSVPNASTVMGSAPQKQLGLASGLQATMRNLGIASGTAMAAALTALLYRGATHETLLPGVAAAPGPLARAACGTFLALSAVAVLGMAIGALPAKRAGAA
jgi:hypothetical protein